MAEALKEAEAAYASCEVPIGAVIVADGHIIGRGHNMTQALGDVTAHAEIIAITAASIDSGKYLSNATIYVTLEPCIMCAGAIGWSHIKRIVYGASDKKRGYTTFLNSETSPFHPHTIIESGVMEEECRTLLLNFFQRKLRGR